MSCEIADCGSARSNSGTNANADRTTGQIRRQSRDAPGATGAPALLMMAGPENAGGMAGHGVIVFMSNFDGVAGTGFYPWRVASCSKD